MLDMALCGLEASTELSLILDADDEAISSSGWSKMRLI